MAHVKQNHATFLHISRNLFKLTKVSKIEHLVELLKLMSLKQLAILFPNLALDKIMQQSTIKSLKKLNQRKLFLS